MTDIADSHADDFDPRQSIVWKIAGYVEEARATRAPQASREAALKCMFDVIICAAAGIRQGGVTAVHDQVQRNFAPGSIPVWFTGSTSSTIGAAWANSTAASTLDLDDGHLLCSGHPGAAVIPTALAVGLETGATLDQIVDAIVIGYEVGVTIGHARNAYGTTGTWSSYAVVATAAALRGSPRGVIAHALAAAGESAPNQKCSSAPAPRIPLPEGSDIKEGIPWSVVTGLMSLGVAEGGFTGPRHILDTIRYYTFPSDLSLGSAQYVQGTYFKLYSCCRHLHAPIDALRQVLDNHDIDRSAIRSIEVETHTPGLRITNKTRPSNFIDMQFSIPYCLALTALAGPPSLLPLTADALIVEGATALADKVVLSLNPGFDDAYPSRSLTRVTVVVGKYRFASDVMEADGEPAGRFPWEQLEAKFRAATRLLATNDQQNELLEAVGRVRAGDPVALFQCLRTWTLKPFAKAQVSR